MGGQHAAAYAFNAPQEDMTDATQTGSTPAVTAIAGFQMGFNAQPESSIRLQNRPKPLKIPIKQGQFPIALP